LVVPLFIPSFMALFSDVISRIPQSPVTAIGYVKWGGILQMVLGIYGIRLAIFEDNKEKRFMALWAIAFMLLGAYSFRFRDPYSMIPVSLFAGYAAVTKVIPFLRARAPSFNIPVLSARQVVAVGVLFLVAFPSLQGTYSAVSYITPPTITELDAMEWINGNTPEDSIFLTWKEEGYTIIGETHREDIITWNKVFMGFFGDAPTVKESNETYYDVVDMMVSPNRNYAYDLMQEYGVDYVYYDKRMWTMGLFLGGLSEYLPYDTHFDPMFANGYSMICEYVEDPIVPDDNSLMGTGRALDTYLDQFWNGYSYCDFDDGFKGDYVENARIAYLYHTQYALTGEEKYRERYEWLVDWLLYKQLPDGGWCEVKPPDEYSLTTALTLLPLFLIEDENPSRLEAVDNATAFLESMLRDDYIMTSHGDERYSRMVSSLCAWVFEEAGRQDVASTLMQKVLDQQKDGGAWSGSTAENIVIMRGLALYLKAGGDIGDSLLTAADWLDSKLDDDGAFKDHDPDKYNIEQYTSSMLIYDTLGDADLADREMGFIGGYYVPMDEKSPLGNFMDLFMDLSFIYGPEEAIAMAESFI